MTASTYASTYLVSMSCALPLNVHDAANFFAFALDAARARDRCRSRVVDRP
jgi:hypothetical protein